MPALPAKKNVDASVTVATVARGELDVDRLGLLSVGVDHAVGRTGQGLSLRLARVEVVEGLEDSVALPAASVDLAFVCDTYHHFEYPRSTLASLYAAIRPGGSLVILDFERVPGKSDDWVLEHVRAGKEVFRSEIESAGFRFEREVKVEDLKENYVLRFRRP